MTPSKINLMSTYALLVLIWATTPLAIIWSVTDLHSLWALAVRFFIALRLSIVLLLIVGANFSVNAQSLHSYLAGACSFI